MSPSTTTAQGRAGDQLPPTEAGKRGWLARTLLSIASRRFDEDCDRKAASLVMVRNSIRLALAEASEADVGRAILQVLAERRGSPCP